MIVSYRDARSRRFAAGKRVKAFFGFERSARLKLELNELDMSAAELARQLDVPTNRITEIINGKRAITGDTTLRLAHFFGTSPELWLNLQSLYDLRVAEQKSGKTIEKLPKLKNRHLARISSS
jgi:addiction module HigA family antidote